MKPGIQEKKFEVWQHGLLDVGKRNKMMNYRKTKRSTLQITSPSMELLYQRLAVKDETITFKKKVDTSSNKRLTGMIYLMDKMDQTIELTTGEIASDQKIDEMNRTLKQLRQKANLSLEEQGINILYLSCGFLEWRQKPSENPIISPLVLVPVSLEINSITDPYKLKKMDEDIVVNPTLEYVLHNDYNITLPELDSSEEDIMSYLDKVQKLVAPSGWTVIREANLGLLSFLKIVMYKDLEKYKDRIFSNPVIQAFCGDPSELPALKDEWMDYEHDQTSPKDCFQVVNADASQQDAILLSKNGVSFVLQGPPGTGKSQTITNIIAEGLADGKRILFVSEKMAALSVVYRRLQEVNLADYCLPLHNYKAEKKQVIQNLIDTLDAPKKKLKAGAADFLSELEEERELLNTYFEELNKKREPLNMTLYEVITELTSLEAVPFYRVTEEAWRVTDATYKNRVTILRKYKDFLDNYAGNIMDNPWKGTSVEKLTYDLEHEIKTNMASLAPYLFGVSVMLDCINEEYNANIDWTWTRFTDLVTQIKRYRLLVEIQQNIVTYYSDKIAEDGDMSQVAEINEKFAAIEKFLQDFNLSTDLIDTLVARDGLRNRIQGQEKLIEQLECWINEFNTTFNTQFPLSITGMNQITELVKAMMSAELFEKNWKESNRRYQRAGEHIAAGFELFATIDAVRKEQYNYLFGNILKENPAVRNYKKLGDAVEFYITNKDRIEKAGESLREAKRATRRAGIDDDAVRNSWFRSDTLASLKEKLEQVVELIMFLNDCKARLDSSITIDDLGTQKVEALLGVLTVQNRILQSWIEIDNYSQIRQLFISLKDTAFKVEKLKSELDEGWSSDIYSLDSGTVLGRFRTDYTSFFKRLGGQYKQDKRALTAAKKGLIGKLDDPTCVQMLEKLQEYNDTLAVFNGMVVDAERWYDTYFNGLSTDWNVLAAALEDGVKANEYYHKNGMDSTLLGLVTQPYQARRDYVVAESTVGQVMQSGKISAFNDLARDYEKRNLMSVKLEIESQIAAVNALINECEAVEKMALEDIDACFYGNLDRTFKDDLTAESYFKYVEYLNKTVRAISDFEDRKEEIRQYIPGLYEEYETDWNKVKNVWKQAEYFTSYALKHSVSDSILDVMAISRRDRADKKVQNYSLHDISDGILADTYKELMTLSVDSISDKKNFLAQLRAVADEADQLAGCAEAVIKDERFNKSLAGGLHFLDKCLTVLDKCDETQYRYAGMEEEYGVPYANYEYTESVFELLDEYLEVDVIEDRAKEFMEDYESMPKTAFMDKLQKYLEAITTKNMENENFNFFMTCFPSEDFTSMPVRNLVERVDACQDIAVLNAWLNYIEMTKQVSAIGLGDYLAYMQENNVPNTRIIPIYKKGFLTKWYYDVLEQDNGDYILKFQDYAHESSIEHFKMQDVKQMKLAQARLDEMLSHKKPSGVNVMSNAMDEISILRKEGGKKRKIMPLRKLFKVIPTLLQKLKPCFMMSPLSVSYFLDSDMYEFDMVIFDEASQILPEDAIGAIYRGNQVIIAGDTKQMPPTSFFSAAAKNTDDYDTEDEDDETYVDIVSESILDEANTCLPSCMLSWHYRSKDESLIAFSNQEIYGNKLITFPNCKKGIDRGLEYIYVPNGYYEGKPKNCNIMEAKRCVQLVAQHIANHPERSLGIIAFSEKQQSAIEDAINSWRLKNPMYEDFFSEDKEEPFFVKNLENVQGDERDTIIFSICYAKNKQGKMYMRFGPLGLAGGERRLNVAITRAKYNVKLVGSIYPNDLNITETTPLGVQLLAKYISYAMANDYEMPMGSSELATDEYFVDMVADFIIESGYRIRRNVGASQYKLDIAVLHPDSSNEFFAGIECDGGNYTMARTARDRDVTRKNIMTMMGWDMYHIWSVAWYKNPDATKQKLIAFLKEASMKYSSSKSVAFIPDMVSDIDMLEDSIDVSDMTYSTDSTGEVHALQFAKYRACDPWRAQYVSGEDNYSNLERRIMYVMEHEAPIHKELLYKRLATVFGRQKATAPVIRTVDDCIARRMSRKMTQRGDFWYLPNTNDIVARVPVTEDDKRPMEYICPEEIENAIVEILKLAFGLTLDDLVAETARQFGFQRRGPKINQVIIGIYERMLEQNIVKVSDEKIYLTGEV